MQSCLWCNGSESSNGYKPGNHVDFVCSGCVQLLCGLSQDKLRELQEQCQARGFERRLEAQKSFIGELEYVPETRKIRSGMVRKGPVRPVRPARYEIRT